MLVLSRKEGESILLFPSGNIDPDLSSYSLLSN